ncbi:uncharacterized protein TNCV_733701 [Trichonephila clavipes]|nr:uncharacterized protein TNCV_733701 [Trichonephila clavipes]
MSAAGMRVVGKFMPKFEGPYRVLEVRNNNLIIWKKGKRVTVNIDQVRVYHPRQSDTVWIVMLRHYMKDRDLVMDRVDRTQENPKDLGKPRVRRPSKTARMNTRGAKEQWNRQYPAKQPQEKEPQHASLWRRSGG